MLDSYSEAVSCSSAAQLVIQVTDIHVCAFGKRIIKGRTRRVSMSVDQPHLTGRVCARVSKLQRRYADWYRHSAVVGITYNAEIERCRMGVRGVKPDVIKVIRSANKICILTIDGCNDAQSCLDALRDPGYIKRAVVVHKRCCFIVGAITRRGRLNRKGHTKYRRRLIKRRTIPTGVAEHCSAISYNPYLRHQRTKAKRRAHWISLGHDVKQRRHLAAETH